MEPQSPSKPTLSPAIISLIVIVIIALLGGGAYLASQSQPTETTQNNTSNTVVEDQPATTNEAPSHKDGEYSASGTYTSPGGEEKVAVKLTLKDDKITEIDVTPQAATPTSTQYQGEFVSGYKGLVVGKDIDEVKLSKVSGSSLTSRGFNDALEQIKQDAQS